MAVYFFDSSALVKRYVQETGTAWVVGVLDPTAGNDLYMARIAGAEKERDNMRLHLVTVKNGEKYTEDSPVDRVYFKVETEEMGNRIVRAFQHAAKLCGATTPTTPEKKKEPF